MSSLNMDIDVYVLSLIDNLSIVIYEYGVDIEYFDN